MNYDALLTGWAALTTPATVRSNVSFHGGNSRYCTATAARTTLTTSPKSWTITDAGVFCSVGSSTDDFVTTWKTNNSGTSNTTSITIPTTGTGYLYQVDWNNDGDFLDTDETTLNTGNVTHNFGVAGTYTIRIRGSFPRIYFNNVGDKSKLLFIEQW
jgi:hypothetical protein